MNTYEESVDRIKRLMAKDNAIDLLANIDYKYRTLHEESFALRSLASSGLISEIFGHQLNSNVQHIKETLDNLPEEIKDNNRIKYLQSEINELFNYLFSLTPTHNYSFYSIITGKNLEEYIVDFYSNYRTNISWLSFNDNLDLFKKNTNTSKLFPAIINLINNARYWAKNVRLDVISEKEITITDDGPGVSIEDQHNLFRLSYTKRPNGRGIGLYVTKLLLNSIGAEVEYVNDYKDTLGGASFNIKFK